MAFRERASAGRRLARALADHHGRPDVVVLGLPRGGVLVAEQVAEALRAPLDVFVVRKLGVPGHPELALGAIGSGGIRTLNHDVVRGLGISARVIGEIAMDEARELERREREYRAAAPPLDVRGKTAILVDDGLATGATMRAAVAALRQRGPARLVVAVPVSSREASEDIRRLADELVCLATPEPFLSVGAWYDEFAQTTDEEVREALARAAARRGADRDPGGAAGPPGSAGRGAGEGGGLGPQLAPR